MVDAGGEKVNEIEAGLVVRSCLDRVYGGSCGKERASCDLELKDSEENLLGSVLRLGWK